MVRCDMQIYWKTGWLWYDSTTGGAANVLRELIFGQKRRGAILEFFATLITHWTKTSRVRVLIFRTVGERPTAYLNLSKTQRTLTHYADRWCQTCKLFSKWAILSALPSATERPRAIKLCPRPRGRRRGGVKLAPGAFATLRRRGPQARAHIWVEFLCKGGEWGKWQGPKGRADALDVVVLWR